jgi:hypothetical protein
MQELFHRMDGDHDGALTYSEFHALLDFLTLRLGMSTALNPSFHAAASVLTVDSIDENVCLTRCCWLR